MPPRLIAIDLDGTLLNTSGHVSPRNLAALHLAEASGIEVVISTGRRHSFAMRVLRDLHLHPSSAVVSSNGTVIRTIGAELLSRTHLPLSTARWLCSHLADYRNTLVLTFDLADLNGEDARGALVVEHLDDLHTSIGRWMRANEPYPALFMKALRLLFWLTRLPGRGPWLIEVGGIAGRAALSVCSRGAAAVFVRGFPAYAVCAERKDEEDGLPVC